MICRLWGATEERREGVLRWGVSLTPWAPDGASWRQVGGSHTCVTSPDGRHCRGVPHINTGAPEPTGWIQGEKSQGTCGDATTVEGENSRGRKVPSDCHEVAGWGNNGWPEQSWFTHVQNLLWNSSGRGWGRFLFSFFLLPWHTACSILVLWQGIEPLPPTLEAQSSNPGPPGNSHWGRFLRQHLSLILKMVASGQMAF